MVERSGSGLETVLQRLECLLCVRERLLCCRFVMRGLLFFCCPVSILLKVSALSLALDSQLDSFRLLVFVSSIVLVHNVRDIGTFLHIKLTARVVVG